MEPAFWLQRWQQNLTGFHRSETNPHLPDYWSEPGVPAGGQVLVPLCGKSLDMLWLRSQGHRVLGVELSSLAVDAFFDENNLQAEHLVSGKFALCQSDELQVLCGDFFDLGQEQLVDVTAVYDRASLIALPSAMRIAFVEKLQALLPGSVSMLLITMEYDQRSMNGPPFSVSEDEVRSLFTDGWSIKKIHEKDILAEEPRFRERGLTFLTEKVYLLDKG